MFKGQGLGLGEVGAGAGCCHQEGGAGEPGGALWDPQGRGEGAKGEEEHQRRPEEARCRRQTRAAVHFHSVEAAGYVSPGDPAGL